MPRNGGNNSMRCLPEEESRLSSLLMAVLPSGVDSELMGVAPLLIWPERLPASLPLDSIGGPKGPNAQFLRDFGKTLVEKYNPKAIVVFSAHWETHGHIEGNHTPPPGGNALTN
jgi:hypothetical protein